MTSGENLITDVNFQNWQQPPDHHAFPLPRLLDHALPGQLRCRRVHARRHHPLREGDREWDFIGSFLNLFTLSKFIKTIEFIKWLIVESEISQSIFFMSAAINDCLSIGGIQDIQVKLFNRLSVKSPVVTYRTKKEKKHDLLRGWGFNSLEVRSMSVPSWWVWKLWKKSQIFWRIFGGEKWD